MGQPLLRPDQRQHLALRVERDAEALLEPLGVGRPQLQHPRILRIALVARLRGGLGERLDHDLGGRQIGIADREVDHVDASSALLGDLAGICGEMIRR